MKFSKDILREEKMDEAIETNLIDSSRWSLVYEMIFEHEGKYYASSYSVGATEQQDESPYENDPDEIECQEVHKVIKTVEVWEPV
jgi:hypothetical protein